MKMPSDSRRYLSILDSSSASRSFCFLKSSLPFLKFAVCFSVSTVLLNAEINQCHHEGFHGESVAPVSGLGDELEELEISFVIEPQKRNGNGIDPRFLLLGDPRFLRLPKETGDL